MRKFTDHLHSNNSSVKAFLATGGSGKKQTEAMSAMACKKENRRSFIQSTIEKARQYNFDGVNLGWEFPIGKQGMDNFVSLIAEFRVAVDKEASQTGKTKLGISVSVLFGPDLSSLKDSRHSPYPAADIAPNVDFVNVMCYDYAGYWNTSRTGSIAGLYNNSSRYSTRYGIQKWIEGGVPREKLVMGLPLFGRTWKLQDRKNNGIGAAAVGIGSDDDECTKGEGYMLYYNVVTYNDNHNATEIYDEDTESYYSYSGTNWISYDGEKSIEAKVRYAQQKRLGGYYFFAIEQDCQDNRLSKAGSRNAWNG
ncbi:hypothetical protein MKX01_031132 [Papaver californicum]|nr:hypothetical protein MKX01_031132 [Papaver californicum]